jgi:hypothetical protein
MLKTKEKVKEWLIEKNIITTADQYIINDDLSVDVDGDVRIFTP